MTQMKKKRIGRREWMKGRKEAKKGNEEGRKGEGKSFKTLI